jgi:hypothetical protein
LLRLLFGFCSYSKIFIDLGIRAGIENPAEEKMEDQEKRNRYIAAYLRAVAERFEKGESWSRYYVDTAVGEIRRTDSHESSIYFANQEARLAADTQPNEGMGWGICIPVERMDWDCDLRPTNLIPVRVLDELERPEADPKD